MTVANPFERFERTERAYTTATVRPIQAEGLAHKKTKPNAFLKYNESCRDKSRESATGPPRKSARAQAGTWTPANLDSSKIGLITAPVTKASLTAGANPNSPPRYELILAPERGVDGVRALRALLKISLRKFRLRAVSVREVRR